MVVVVHRIDCSFSDEFTLIGLGPGKKTFLSEHAMNDRRRNEETKYLSHDLLF